MLKCPFCGRELNGPSRHSYKCDKRPLEMSDDEVKIAYIKCNYGETIFDDVKNDYENNFSLPMLKEKYGLSFRTTSSILSLLNIKQRTISEAQHLISVPKSKKTCLKKWGCENPSQAQEIKDKKAATFIEHYGVDNIWKTKEYAEFTSNRWKSYTPERKNELLKQWSIKYGSVSKLEKRIELSLKYLNIKISTQYKFKDYYHKYDFRIKGTNIIIEVNGDFWHANPKLYSADDILHFSKNVYHKAKDLWHKDEENKNIAEKHGFTVIYIWESEICDINDDELAILIIDKINKIKNNY